jgi:hypothetical protein
MAGVPEEMQDMAGKYPEVVASMLNLAGTVYSQD